MSYRAATVYISGSLVMQAHAHVVRQKLIDRIDALVLRLVVSGGNFVNYANARRRDGWTHTHTHTRTCDNARNAHGFASNRYALNQSSRFLDSRRKIRQRRNLFSLPRFAKSEIPIIRERRVRQFFGLAVCTNKVNSNDSLDKGFLSFSF